MRKRKYKSVCVEDEESIIHMLNGELDIDSDDEMDLESKGESASEELSSESSECECESETSVVCIDAWENVTMGDKKPKAYTFTTKTGSQFNLLPDAEPMDYFTLFLNDELLNNIVTEKNSTPDTKFRNFSLA
jgi:hypothetical protein